MAVTAKFVVSRLTPYGKFEVKDGRIDGECKMAEVELTPDYAQGKNKEWAEATPAGVIRMTITNPVALAQFSQGRSFTIVFEPETAE